MSMSRVMVLPEVVMWLAGSTCCWKIWFAISVMQGRISVLLLALYA